MKLRILDALLLGYQFSVSQFRDTLIPVIPRLMQQNLTKRDRHQKQQRLLRVVDVDCAAWA